MDATTFSAPCGHLLLAPSALHLHGPKILGGRGEGSPARVKTWSKGAELGGQNGERLRANSLFGDGGGGGGGDGFRTVRRRVKLNSAIQNRSVREMLELVGDECLHFFSKISSIDVSQMGKNMFLLLHAMMLKHHVSFVLKPTENESFDLGVKWSLEWEGKKLPWDLDCNITTNHVYMGMLLINEVNKVYVPLLQRILQIIHQNLDAIILTLANKFLPEGTLDERDRRTIVTCVIIDLVVMLVFYNMFKNL